MQTVSFFRNGLDWELIRMNGGAQSASVRISHFGYWMVGSFAPKACHCETFNSPVLPDRRLTPCAPLLPGAQRRIIASLARASGSSRRPPSSRLSTSFGSCARAVRQMFSPALIWRSNRQPHLSQINTWPTLLRRSLISPHLGQVLLVYLGSTLIIGTPLSSALYSIWRCISR